MSKAKYLPLIIGIIFIIIGATLRLFPHPPNFAPIGAIALFGGVYFSRKLGLALPVAAMFLSDIFIGFYQPFLMSAVYISFLLTVILGFWLKKHKKWYTIGGGAILSGVLFFVLTNFAVWAFTPWYPKTFSGLIQCYLLAIPFFKNTILGNLFYATCFFGIYEFAWSWVKKSVGIRYRHTSLRDNLDYGLRRDF